MLQLRDLDYMHVHRRPHRICLCLFFLVSPLGQGKIASRDYFTVCHSLPGKLSRYSNWLQAGRSEIESRWGQLSRPALGPTQPPVQHVPGLSRGKKRLRRDADHSPLLVPWLRKSRALPLLPQWAVRPVQSLSACTLDLYLYSPYGLYSLYRASVPVQ